jgi:hypothetical protein
MDLLVLVLQAVAVQVSSQAQTAQRAVQAEAVADALPAQVALAL